MHTVGIVIDKKDELFAKNFLENNKDYKRVELSEIQVVESFWPLNLFSFILTMKKFNKNLWAFLQENHTTKINNKTVSLGTY